MLDAALQRAQTEHKLLALGFSAAWCAPCKRMEQTTFVDSQVAVLLQQCVLVKLDTDAQPELTQKLGVVGLPDIRLVTPEGSVVRQLRGFIGAEVFAGEMKAALQKLVKQ